MHDDDHAWSLFSFSLHILFCSFCILVVDGVGNHDTCDSWGEGGREIGDGKRKKEGHEKVRKQEQLKLFVSVRLSYLACNFYSKIFAINVQSNF